MNEMKNKCYWKRFNAPRFFPFNKAVVPFGKEFPLFEKEGPGEICRELEVLHPPWRGIWGLRGIILLAAFVIASVSMAISPLYAATWYTDTYLEFDEGTFTQTAIRSTSTTAFIELERQGESEMTADDKTVGLWHFNDTEPTELSEDADAILQKLQPPVIFVMENGESDACC